MSSPSRFPARVFHFAGIYGIVVLLPQYLVETGVGPALPEPLVHPEHFYGFVGVALAWQLVFLLIARDPQRYRPLMLLGLVEKLSFGLATVALFAARRVEAMVVAFGLIDLAIGALFVLAYRRTPGPAETAVTPSPA